MNNLFEKPYNDPQQYYWFENGFSESQLSKIEADVQEIKPQFANTFGNVTDGIRSSTVRWIPQDENWEWLYNTLREYIEEANKQLWGFDLVSMPEQIQYTEYHADQKGHYGWHQDIGPGEGSQRKVSVTVQLSESDEYEGGELQFMYGSNSYVSAPRGAGVVVVFPSYMMHQVTEVTKGTRKSFVLWVGGEHYK